MIGRIANQDFSLFGLWPSHEQDIMLRAAILNGEPALAAFHEWLGLIDLDQDFDRATFRLLPLLYGNLRKLGVTHPIMGRLKGVYRLTWYKNHKLFDSMRPVLAALVHAGIRTMLLKGAPLVLKHYSNHALRPMTDIDVLVPAAYAPRAIDVLKSLGWRPFDDPSPDAFKYRHALMLSSADNREIDIHWHCPIEFAGSGNDDFLWSSARPLDFNGVATLAPDPTRHLIVTILHGLRWNSEPPIRWIPDAMILLRTSGGDIAWDEFVGFARDRQLTCRLHLGLSDLQNRFDAPIPEGVLAELQRVRTSVIERIENTVVLRDIRPLYLRPAGNLWIIFSNYCRYARGAGPVEFLVGFSHYLRFRMQLRGRLEIPRVIARGLWKRLLAFIGIWQAGQTGRQSEEDRTNSSKQTGIRRLFGRPIFLTRSR